MENSITFTDPGLRQDAVQVNEREEIRRDEEKNIMDHHLADQLPRRYSIDDNGGGYAGL